MVSLVKHSGATLTKEYGMTERLTVKAPKVAETFDMAVSSVYRLAKAYRIPTYKVGPKMTGLRFVLDEVREALRRPVNGQKAAVK